MPVGPPQSCALGFRCATLKLRESSPPAPARLDLLIRRSDGDECEGVCSNKQRLLAPVWSLRSFLPALISCFSGHVPIAFYGLSLSLSPPPLLPHPHRRRRRATLLLMHNIHSCGKFPPRAAITPMSERVKERCSKESLALC